MDSGSYSPLPALQHILIDSTITRVQAGAAGVLLPLTRFVAGALLNDKGYDSDAFVEAIRKQGRQPVILACNTRMAAHEHDGFVYKERHLSFSSDSAAIKSQQNLVSVDNYYEIPLVEWACN